MFHLVGFMYSNQTLISASISGSTLSWSALAAGTAQLRVIANNTSDKEVREVVVKKQKISL